MIGNFIFMNVVGDESFNNQFGDICGMPTTDFWGVNVCETDWHSLKTRKEVSKSFSVRKIVAPYSKTCDFF